MRGVAWHGVSVSGYLPNVFKARKNISLWRDVRSNSINAAQWGTRAEDRLVCIMLFTASELHCERVYEMHICVTHTHNTTRACAAVCFGNGVYGTAVACSSEHGVFN